MEEKKEVKVNLGTAICIAIIIILLSIIGGMWYNYNYLVGEAPTKENVSNVVQQNVADTNITENQTEKSPYEKYEGLVWRLKDSGDDNTKLEFDNKKIQIENEVAYLYSGNSKTPINSIKGKAKSVNSWGEATLERVYILTEDGTMWQSNCDDSGLNKNFVKVNMDAKVLDMTYGDNTVRVVEPPYFLLENGKLVNEEGSLYEELEGEFVKSFGNNWDRVYVKADNTIYVYDAKAKEYVQKKDENNQSIKMKDGFIQFSTTRNNLIEDGGSERIFIITEDDKLLYFDLYSDVTVKEYKAAAGKTVENAVEEKKKDQYGGELTNVRVTFSDGKEILLKDAYKNFFENLSQNRER